MQGTPQVGFIGINNSILELYRGFKRVEARPIRYLDGASRKERHSQRSLRPARPRGRRE